MHAAFINSAFVVKRTVGQFLGIPSLFPPQASTCGGLARGRARGLKAPAPESGTPLQHRAHHHIPGAKFHCLFATERSAHFRVTYNEMRRFWLVQHRFCKFPAGWFCAATLPRRTSPAGDFFGVFCPTFTKESTTWHNA